MFNRNSGSNEHDILQNQFTSYLSFAVSNARIDFKLIETARSYKMLALEADTVNGFAFVWFTDGKGWTHAKHNLEETFVVMQHIYNINDLENGIISEIFR